MPKTTHAKRVQRQCLILIFARFLRPMFNFSVRVLFKPPPKAQFDAFFWVTVKACYATFVLTRGRDSIDVHRRGLLKQFPFAYSNLFKFSKKRSRNFCEAGFGDFFQFG